jgi:putative spermidine/putrescine transport system substrate-binding protein
VTAAGEVCRSHVTAAQKEGTVHERSAINPGSDRSRERDGVTRRHVLKRGVTTGTVMLASLSAPAVITPARAAECIIKVGMYSNPRTELIKATLIKRFEARHRVKFLIDEGLTTEQLARLRATRHNPVHTVMWMDDIGVNIAKKEGLIDQLPADKIPNLAQVSPQYVVEAGYGVGIDVSPIALTYSTKNFAEAPGSWAALWNPAYRGKIAVPTIAATHGVNLVVVAAALETGKPFQEAQYDSDAAFKKLAQLKPNLHSIYNKSALLVAAMQQGEVIMTGPYYGHNIWPYIEQGLPANHVIPAEGGFAGLSCQTLVHGGPYPDLGAEFINEMLDPEVQAMMSKKLSNTPVVQGLDLPPETLARVPYGPGKEGLLFVCDWEFINTMRAEWTERWNQAFS